jgi:pyruvate dehydrogenase E2 component (dihydrolipoamide acetyltransferase)
VTVPDIGDFTDVPVIEILVAVGDAVAADDPLLTLESDKATMDIPAPAAGTVAELLVCVGDTVSEGAALLTLSSENGASGGEGAAASDGAAADGGTPAERPAPAGGSPAPVTDIAAASVIVDVPPEARRDGGEANVYASPSVRRLARELHVDLAGVSGSGRKGRIVPEDVRAAAAGAGAGGAPSPSPVSAPARKVDFEKFGPVERVALTRIQRLSGPNIHRSWSTIPHVTQHEDADITELEAFRVRTNAEQEVKLTMVALLLKACVASLKEFPQFNASLDGEEIVLKRYYHLGFAADTAEGLLVPVIRDVDQKGLLRIGQELRTLSAAAREGKLKLGDMQGATFTISSLGGIGGTGFSPIINAPEVAILGVSRSTIRPVWDGEQFVPRLMLPLSLSYDHRVIDGAAAARFCVHLAGVLCDLRRVLL